VSFGIVCREEYDPISHQGEDIVKDPFDKKRWAEQQICWIIRQVCISPDLRAIYYSAESDQAQGDLVRADSGVSQPYRLKIEMGKEHMPWKTRIVMSSLPESQLPRSIKRDGSREICTVEATLQSSDLKRKNRHWYNLAKEYSLAEFEVRVLIGTGLKFQIWSKDGVRSRDHGEIEVKWENGEGKGKDEFLANQQAEESFKVERRQQA